MAEKIIMPQLGESIAEGTIVKWLKNPGDAVQKDENIVLISTDKVEAEIPSPTNGVLVSVDVEPGKTVPVGTVLGYVGAAGEKGQAKPVAAAPEIKKSETKKVEAEAESSSQSEESESSPEAVITSGGSRFVSPLVKKIASENQLGDQELSGLSGTGFEGRVTKKDLMDYLGQRKSAPSASTAPTIARPTAPQVMIPAGERELVKPVSTMRRVIMQNMMASRQTSAHVTTFFEVDYTKIDQVRNANKDRFKTEEGVALTYTTFLAMAVCQAIKRHPYINAEITGDKIKFKKDVHLGIAVALTDPEPGLMVPVIRNADQMNLRGLSQAIHDLANRTRTRKIKPDELSGGSFTITNPGNYGAVIGTPIINQPQVAILGVGQIKKQAVVIEVDGTDTIGVRNMGWLSLSFDHRLIDGATADIFMGDLKQTLESWSTVP